MISVIPLVDYPQQSVQVTLSNQRVYIRLYQRSLGLFMDISIDGAMIKTGVICQNLNLLVRDKYLGMIGDIYFYDMQGKSDPSCNVAGELGNRFLLLYNDSI